MRSATQVLGWIAFGWSAILNYSFAYMMASGESLLLLEALLPLGFSIVGLVGTFRNSFLTWLGAVGMIIFIFDPFLVGILFAPGALCLLIAAITQTFLTRVDRVHQSTNGGHA